MALIVSGITKCALCDSVLKVDDAIVGVPAVKNMAYICETKGQTHPFPPKQVL